MTNFRVTWVMDIEAETAEEAARQALEIHRDPESIATVFTVGSAPGEEAIIADRLIDLGDSTKGTPGLRMGDLFPGGRPRAGFYAEGDEGSTEDYPTESEAFEAFEREFEAEPDRMFKIVRWTSTGTDVEVVWE